MNGDTDPDFPYLDNLTFVVYVEGVNGSGISPDIAVMFHYKIAPGYILGSTSLEFKEGNNAILFVDIVLGVKRLSRKVLQL